MTQFLTSHGCLRKNVHRFSQDSSPICPSCVDEEEDTEQIPICCPSFKRPAETSSGLMETVESAYGWHKGEI